MAAIAVPATRGAMGNGLRWLISDSLTITRRNLSHIRRMPEKLIDVTVQPVLFYVLFTYVFGSAIVLPGSANYRDFLVPGIFTMTMMTPFQSTAVGFSTDMSNGIIDRFRSLPIGRGAVLIGRTVADLIETSLGLVVLLVCTLIAGWRPDNSIAEVLGAFGILLLFAFAMNWVGVFLGLIVRTPEAVQAAAMLVMFPLMFISNTFVPTQGMPAWLRVVADWNPLSAVVGAVRELVGGPHVAVGSSAWPLEHAVAAGIIGPLVMIAVFAPLAIWRYRNATSR